MEVTWRGAEYDFEPKVIQGGGDNYTKYSNIDGLIFGSDTESVQLKDRYEPQCFTLSDPFGGDYLRYIPERENAFRFFLDWFLKSYFDTLLEHGSHHLLYYHNLEYDWLQLVKNDERLLELAKIGVSPAEDIDLFRFDGFRIKMKKNALFAGSAPHVKLRIEKGSKKNKCGFTLYIYDTFSFFPSSLAKVAKDLNMDVEKMERQESLGQVDFRQVDDTDEEKIYFEKYAKIDSRVTQKAGENIRNLHREAGMTKIRPSSPAYAINLLFHMMTEEQSIKTGTYNQKIMQLILDTYRGGRTGGIYHGEVRNISVLDFHSSYPASMLSLPSFSPDMQYIELEGEELELENVLSILEETGNAFLKISGREIDPRYPSLLTTHNGKLTPIYGEFSEVSTTGYEFFVGVKSGGLTDIVIHECVVLLDMEEEPFLPFKEFATNAYIEKNNSIKGTVPYMKAKLVLVASYGKLIESRTQTMIGATDSRDYLPYIEGMEKDFGNFYYSEYVKAIEQGKRLGDIYEDLLQQLEENFPDEYENMEQKMFGDFSLSGRIYGRYVVPAAASLITGCSRARLLAGMKALEALYWDTDSLFVEDLTDDIEQVNLLLAPTLEWLPMNTVPVRIGDELGELDFEMVHGHGFLAGTKRYYLTDDLYDSNQYDDKGKRLGTCKRATHGIPALSSEKIPEVIEALATGRNYQYTSKQRPLKAKEAKTANDVGSFRTGDYNSQFHLDDRLQWEKTTKGWIGNVTPFYEMGVKELTEEEYQTYLEKLFGTELNKDYIKEGIKQEGYIQVIGKDDAYFGEYKMIPAHRKRMYFRKDGIPIDVWCSSLNLDINQLLEELRL